MKRVTEWIWRGVRVCAAGVFTVVLWTLWLGLCITLTLQLYIMVSREPAVPGFVQHRIEQRLEEAGFRLQVARTSFDPSGRILFEDARFSLPEYPEPVITARAVYVELNPWALAVGKFDPRQISITGASVAVPAMLSRSGRAEEIISDLDATVAPTEKQVMVNQFSARVGRVSVSARGAFAIARSHNAKTESLTALVSAQFPKLCREAVTVLEQLEALEDPALHLDLSPNETRGAIVSATLFARGLTLETPLAAHMGELRIFTRLPLFGDAPAASRLELMASDLTLPMATSAHSVRALLIGRFQSGGFKFTPRELQVS